MKLTLKGLLVTALLATGLTASTQDIQIFTSENADGKITPVTIEAVFKKAGFVISANRDMNVPFYNLFTIFSKKETLELVKKYPNIGLFAPMSMSIYTRKGEKKISVSSLSVEAMAKILKIPADDKVLVKVGKMVKDALKSAMPKGKFEILPYTVQKPIGELVSSYKMEMDEEDWDSEFDEFQIEFEGQLAPNGFVMAGFTDMTFHFDEADYEDFDFYSVYSICKLPVIYTVAKVHPEAGAYAPCSLYMSKKKDDNNMNIAFPSVYNWISSMDIKDKESLEVLLEAQESMHKILTGLIE